MVIKAWRAKQKELFSHSLSVSFINNATLGWSYKIILCEGACIRMNDQSLIKIHYISSNILPMFPPFLRHTLPNGKIIISFFEKPSHVNGLRSIMNTVKTSCVGVGVSLFSCYYLEVPFFKGWLLPSPPPGCQCSVIP